MDEEDYWIPRNLDAPPLFFMWEMDSAMIFIVCLLLGGVLNMYVMGLLLAIILGRGYAYLKEEGGKGLLMKILYWYTPSDIWLSPRVPSNVREYVGA